MSTRLNCSHKQSRERNERFAEIARDPEVRKLLECIPKSTHISYLRKLCEEKYGFNVPASAAYKVMSEIDDRFKPKHRHSHTESFVEVERDKVPQAHYVGEPQPVEPEN